MRRHIFEVMMEAAGQVLDAVGQGVLDAPARRRTGLDDSGGEKTQTGGYAQSRQRIIGDVNSPVEGLLKAITQSVHGPRDRFAPGRDVLTNLFRGAFGARNRILFLPLPKRRGSRGQVISFSHSLFSSRVSIVFSGLRLVRLNLLTPIKIVTPAAIPRINPTMRADCQGPTYPASAMMTAAQTDSVAIRAMIAPIATTAAAD